MKYIIVGPDGQSNCDLKKILDSYEILDIGGSFTTFKEAKDYACEDPPDIAFVRVGEAKLNAYELIREIRTRNPFTIVIFMSGHEEYALEAFECEADGFLIDPFDEQKIKNLLRRILELARTRGQSGYFKTIID